MDFAVCEDVRQRIFWKFKAWWEFINFPQQLRVACPIFVFSVVSTDCFTAVAVFL